MKTQTHKRSTHRAPRNPIIRALLANPKRGRSAHPNRTAYRRKTKHTHQQENT